MRWGFQYSLLLLMLYIAMLGRPPELQNQIPLVHFGRWKSVLRHLEEKDGQETGQVLKKTVEESL